MSEALESILENSGQPGLAELRGLLKDLLAAGPGPVRLLEQQPLGSRGKPVFRLRFALNGQTRSVVIKRLKPDVARRTELVMKRWLPAIGLEAGGTPLLGSVASVGPRHGFCVWQVYDDLGEHELDPRQPNPQHVRAAIELIAQMHTRFAGHPLLGEVRLHGDDLGIRYYEANVRDAIYALEARPPSAGATDESNNGIASSSLHEPCAPLTPSLSPSGGEGARRAGEGESVRFTGRERVLLEPRALHEQPGPARQGSDPNSGCPQDARRALRDRLLERLYWLREDLPRRAAALAGLEMPETLLHGDLWSINVFVTPTGGGLHPRLIDWDHASAGPFTYDLSTLLLRFPAEHRAWMLEIYREAVAKAGWRLPPGPVLDLLLETHEFARYANCLIWPAIAIAMDRSEWGFDSLREMEGWFETFEQKTPLAVEAGRISE